MRSNNRDHTEALKDVGEMVWWTIVIAVCAGLLIRAARTWGAL